MSFYQHERGWLDDAIWENEPYSKREAWSWMIGNAAWKDCLVSVKGQPVQMKRGSFTASLQFLANKWQWNKNKVDRFLTKLEKWQKIKIETAIGTGSGTTQTVVTICNYDEIQGIEKKSGHKTNERRDGGGTEAGRSIINNNKLNKSYAFEGEHVIRLDDDDFEKWLQIYGGNEGQFRDFLWQKDQWYAQQPPEKRKNWFISTANHIRSLRV